jgi:lipoic acid synthetase
MAPDNLENVPDLARAPRLRKPDWLRVPANLGRTNDAVKAMLRELNLHTVCEAAHCPNCGECFGRQVATFMILGDRCTRNCRFCCVGKGEPQPPDPLEPERLAEACDRLGLRHVVITSVTRDDLADGGAGQFVSVIQHIRRLAQAPVIEVLIPDLAGNWAALDQICAARPEIINHNIETIERLYPAIRPEADYHRSLALLDRVRRREQSAVTKSGLMVGLGEQEAEVITTLKDLRAAGCAMVTIGQYLAPSREHAPIVAYIEPAQFDRYSRIAADLGFASVASGPLVRSSYQADRFYAAKSYAAKSVDDQGNQS